MKLTIILAILLALAIGCSIPQDSNTSAISGTKDLLLNEQDLAQLGITSGIDCSTEEYQTGQFSPLAQYSFCSFNLTSLGDSEVVLELKKFADIESLNGTYQYESLHLRGFQGIISENDYGDFSRFYVNNESHIFYYHLWIGKKEYLIHLTSKGSREAGEHISGTGQLILSKFK